MKQVFCVANNFSSSETESDTSILVYVSKEGTTQNKDIMSKKKKKKRRQKKKKGRDRKAGHAAGNSGKNNILTALSIVVVWIRACMSEELCDPRVQLVAVG